MKNRTVRPLLLGIISVLLVSCQSGDVASLQAENEELKKENDQLRAERDQSDKKLQDFKVNGLRGHPIVSRVKKKVTVQKHPRYQYVGQWTY